MHLFGEATDYVARPLIFVQWTVANYKDIQLPVL